MPRYKRTIERDDKIIEFCAGGKTKEEVSKLVGMPPSSVANILARLENEEGRIYTVFPDQKREFGRGGLIALYVKVGTEPDHPPVAHKEKPVEPAEPKWNHEFIAVMHRVLHLGAA